jgi:SAM-dependent MidA family methyltransferase
LAEAGIARKPMQPIDDILRHEIRQRGVIPFARFMEVALYHPEHGYYERRRDPVGKRGDFYTSVSVGPVFGELLAFQFAQWLEPAGPKNPQSAIRNPQWIVEAGAHDGKLAADILGWLRSSRPGLFDRLGYCIVEPSAARQTRQRETLSGFGGKVRWSGSLEELRADGGVCGILFCNELLDAMPVHVLRWNAAQKTWEEQGVGLEDNRFVWRTMACDPVRKIPLRPAPRWLADLPSEFLDVLADGFTVEVSPAAEAWWAEAAVTLKTGQLVALDYGLAIEERLSPGRAGGTLRAYRKHTMSEDVLADPGGQDLTAHVNFSAIESAGTTAGLRTVDFVAQGRFLSRIMADTAKDRSGFAVWTSERVRQFQTLIHPQHLGAVFRVLVQTR